MALPNVQLLEKTQFFSKGFLFFVFPFEISLEISRQFFSPIFSSLCSVEPCVVSIVSNRFNFFFFFALFYVLFEATYGGIDAILNAGESSSSFFSCHI